MRTRSLSLAVVAITAIHSWLSFKEIKQNLAVLKANQELPVLFTFSVDKSSPVNKEHLLTFIISSSNGERWTKEIKVTVLPPDHFELFQNLSQSV